MSTETEGTFEYNGASLYTKTWTPSGTVGAKLIFVHGYSEHINRYNHLFPQLAAQGIQVFAWDQRGWGRSVTKPSERGLTGPTSQVVDDVAAFINDKLPSSDDVPVFVMGHSMGGGEVLTLMSDPAHAALIRQVRGWILHSPFVGFTPGQEPSSLKVALGRLAGRVLPRMQMRNEVPPKLVSRDPEWVRSMEEDELCHNTGTLEGLAGLLDRTAVLSGGGAVAVKEVRRVLVMHGTGDKVCSYDKAMAWLDAQKAVEDKTAKTYEGGYHQLHADDCKDEFAKDLVEWILEKSKGGDGVEAKL